MTSSKYHREQAKILAALALSTDDQLKAKQFQLVAMEHLEKAEVTGSTEVPFTTPGGASQET
jgi:hypothetical protein